MSDAGLTAPGASAEAFHGYAQSGRKSLLSLSQSFEFSEDEEGLRLFDRVPRRTRG